MNCHLDVCKLFVWFIYSYSKYQNAFFPLAFQQDDT